jgi:hypothetical protein
MMRPDQIIDRYSDIEYAERTGELTQAAALGQMAALNRAEKERHASDAANEAAMLASLTAFYQSKGSSRDVAGSMARQSLADEETWCAAQEARGDLAGAPDRIDCYECGGFDGVHFASRAVTALGPVTGADPTQTYRLECGHVAS